MKHYGTLYALVPLWRKTPERSEEKPLYALVSLWRKTPERSEEKPL